jgi:AmmeMemoRadiSam system protein A
MRDNPFTSLAKKAVEIYIKEGRVIATPAGLSQELLLRKAGVFVTITQNGQLRGCIGTYLPTKDNIAREIIDNAVASASRDPRFESINGKDLPFLEYSVSILSKPEQIMDIEELDPKKFGILVRNIPKEGCAARAGLLLPDLEGIDTKQKQVVVACHKAGINPQEEKIAIFKFTTEVYS